MDKTQQLSSSDSPSTTQTPINEANPTGEMLPTSLTPSRESGETDELCQSVNRLNVVDIQKADTIGIDQNDKKSWDSLSGPPLVGLLSLLRNDGDCKDLLNFSIVSPYYRNEAKTFMKGAGNRPGIKLLHLWGYDPDNTGEVMVRIHLFQSNIPFYDLTGLDWNRFKRQDNFKLRVILSGPEDPAVEQLDNLLSTTIDKVMLLDPSLYCFTVAAQLLHNATIRELKFERATINDSTAPMMLEIASHLKPNSNKLSVHSPNVTGLSDPETFLTALCEGITSFSLVHYDSPFFGLPKSFWEKYLNAKLSSGSVGWIQLGWNLEKITKAPINIDPNLRFPCLEWGQQMMTRFP